MPDAQPVLLICAFFLLALRIGIWVWKRSRSGKSKDLIAVESAYRAGDYATGLERSESLQKDPETYGLFRGALLHQTGKLDEAARVLETSMKKQSSPPIAALHRERLGLTLLELERFDDALRCFDQTVNDSPERGEPHRAVAEVLLRRGGHHSEALRRAKIAVEKNRRLHESSAKTGNAEEVQIHLSESLGTLAWATASALNDRIQVDQLVKEAVPMAGAAVPALAKVHFDIGCAYAALGQAEESIRHFQTAARVDSHGHWGRMGKRLAQITSG